jgi:hypothetical protein
MENNTEKLSVQKILENVFENATFTETSTGIWPEIPYSQELIENLFTYENTGEILLSLISKYPKHIYVLNRYLGTGNGFETVPPNIFIEKLHEIKEYPDAWSLWAGEFSALMTYRFRYQESFSQYIISTIENLETISVYKAFEVIDITNNILLGSQGNSYAGGNIGYIKKILYDFSQDSTKSFLKRMYIQQILSADYEYLIPDEGPIKIADGVYGYDEEFSIDDSSILDKKNIFTGRKRNLLIIDNLKDSKAVEDQLTEINDLKPKNSEEIILQLEKEREVMNFFKSNARSLDSSDILISFNLDNNDTKELMSSYRFLMKKWNREQINKITHQDITDLSLKEQFYFTRFFAKATEEQVNDIGKFIGKFTNNGFKTFLSLEHGGSDMGQKILDLSEKLPQETASKIFAKYAEIIDSVENILHVAQNGFKTSIETKPELMQSIEQSLYKRGADLLAQFHENINQNPEEIIAELERINADTITTLSIFKYAAKFGNKLPLEDITGAKFSKKTGNDLEPAEISEMEHIYQANWKTYGNQELIQSVIHKFKESLTGDRAEQEQVYLFKKNDKINAFVKFSELHPGVKYASALNVDQSSKGFGLGETMMDEALYREAQENILVATCDPYNDSNMRYMEKGFIGTGFTGDNPPVMNICWNELMNTHIASKHISSDDLVIMYLKQEIPNTMIIKKADDLHHLHSDFPVGKSLTRCFRDPLHTGSWYAVYETINPEYETNIKTT